MSILLGKFDVHKLLYSHESRLSGYVMVEPLYYPSECFSHCTSPLSIGMHVFPDTLCNSSGNPTFG